MKWEYRILINHGYDHAKTTEGEPRLNQLGDDEWELVAVIPLSDINGETTRVEYIFKRPNP